MKAVVITKFGDAGVLQLREYRRPTISKNQVLIKVVAAGLNRLDIYQREGNYPAPEGVVADIPGLEVAGTIEEMGEEVKQWNIGDKVCALIGGGGYADYVAAHSLHCLPIPKSWSFEEAATLPEAVFTVWHNVFQLGKLINSETFLVHGGTSGIGIASIQLAKAFGASVLITAGSDKKCAFCISLGADIAINYKKEDFEKRLQVTGPDVILDMIGGDYFEKNINILNPEGRLVYINAMKGSAVNLNILKMMRKRIAITGSTLRNRGDAFKSELAQDIHRMVWPVIESGKFNAIIEKAFPMREAAEAHRLMESNQHIGKIVLVNH